jgi:hypothetical protein
MPVDISLNGSTQFVVASIATVDPRREILTSLEVLFSPGQVIELRVPNHPRNNGTASGYFSDRDALADYALSMSEQAPGVYVTLNEINSALLARRHNRIELWAKQTTSDADVVRRRWLPLDFDPKRPAGISSTNEEHNAAIARAQACREWLRERGWPQPIVADSGNGAHLLYAIDLPNDDASKLLVERCLKAIGGQFSDDKVIVDETVGNASRIWKLYGTFSCKGDATTERPHRLAQILQVPERGAAVTEQMEALAVMIAVTTGRSVTSVRSVTARSASSATTYSGNGAAANGTATAGVNHGLDLPRFDIPKLDVRKWLEANGVPFTIKERNGDPRTIYRITCPFDASHTDAAVMQEPNGKLSAKCFHNSCSDKGWQEFKRAIGPLPMAEVPHEAVNDPHRLARLYLNEHQADGVRTLAYWHGEYHRWDGSAYRKLEDAEVKAEVVDRIKREFDRLNLLLLRKWEANGGRDEEAEPTDKPTSMPVTIRLRADVLQALSSLALVPGTMRQPCWLGEYPVTPPPGEMLPCRNGLLHLPTGKLLPPTPRFFSPNALDYDYDPDASDPETWLKFLGQLWDNDTQSKETLQDWFGYNLTPDTSLQKILMLVGPTRAGKGGRRPDIEGHGRGAKRLRPYSLQPRH